MSARGSWRGALVAALASTLVAGCLAPSTAGGSQASRSSPSTPPPGPGETRSPHRSVPGPSAAAPRTTPGARAGSPNEAPAATLVVGSVSYAGEVGGFDFGRYAQSAPWLPAPALDVSNVAAGSTVRVDLDSRATIAEWAAGYAAADDTAGDEVVPLGNGPAPATFGAPPPGEWVLSVTIVFEDGAGSGAYYWHVVVG